MGQGQALARFTQILPGWTGESQREQRVPFPSRSPAFLPSLSESLSISGLLCVPPESLKFSLGMISPSRFLPFSLSPTFPLLLSLCPYSVTLSLLGDGGAGRRDRLCPRCPSMSHSPSPTPNTGLLYSFYDPWNSRASSWHEIQP